MSNIFKNVIKPDKNGRLLLEIVNVCNEVVENIQKLFKSLENVNKRIDNISTSSAEFKDSHTQYYLTPSSAGTGTANEVQVFIDGKVIPISIVPYDLTSVQWRTYYLTRWAYREDLGQTQILFIASDPSAIVNVVCMPFEIPTESDGD